MKKSDKDDIKNTGEGLSTVKYSKLSDFIACPNCGMDMEFWSAADVTSCFFCGHIIFLCDTTVH